MLLDEVPNTKLSAHFGSKKMHTLLSALCVVATDAEFLVSKFVSHVKFVNMLKIAHNYPQACWNPYPLLQRMVWILVYGFHHWDCHLVQIVADAIFTCVDRLTKYTVFTAFTLEGKRVECQIGCTIVFEGCCQTVRPA